MKKFCECNSEWSFVKDESVQLTLCQAHTSEEPVLCSSCHFYMWYNPQYENMMYDLKWMNQ